VKKPTAIRATFLKCPCGRGQVRVPAKLVKPVKPWGQPEIPVRLAVQCAACCREEERGRAGFKVEYNPDGSWYTVARSLAADKAVAPPSPPAPALVVPEGTSAA
jgi:hypothetical protein